MKTMILSHFFISLASTENEQIIIETKEITDSSTLGQMKNCGCTSQELKRKSYTFHFIRWKDFRPAIKSTDCGY